MKNLTIAFVLIVIVASAGCGRMMDIPTDFVPADSWAHPVWAVSADGVVVAMRRPYKNPKNGTAEFWAEAIKNELAERGYKLVSSKKIVSDAGAPGHLLTFSSEQQGAEFTYMLAVYVDKDEVLVAEAGGKADATKAKTDALTKALLSVR